MDSCRTGIQQLVSSMRTTSARSLCLARSQQGTKYLLYICMLWPRSFLISHWGVSSFLMPPTCYMVALVAPKKNALMVQCYARIMFICAGCLCSLKLFKIPEKGCTCCTHGVPPHVECQLPTGRLSHQFCPPSSCTHAWAKLRAKKDAVMTY